MAAKLITILTSSTLDEKYSSCIPFFIDSWKNIGKISGYVLVPHVILIADNIPQWLQPYASYLSLESNHGFPPGFVAQNIRNFAGRKFHTDLVVTTDIDMVPLNLRVIRYGIHRMTLEEKKIVILRDVLPKGQFPICYTMAPPSSWKKLSNSSGSTSTEYLSELADSLGGEQSLELHSHGGEGWYLDQISLFTNIQKHFKESEVLKLQDSETGHRRLDRNRNAIFRYVLPLGLVPFGAYSDFHLPLPISQNKKYLHYINFLQSINRLLQRFGCRHE
jgi:hypothetical protein